MLGGALLVVTAGAQAPTPVAIDPSVVGADIEAISQKITNSLLYGDQQVPYKKHHHASAVLNGLAKICMNIAQFITGGGKEKQQAVLGVVGTVLGTAAQLAGPSSNKQNMVPVQAEFELKIITLTDMLLEDQSNDPIYKVAPTPLLALIKGTERSARSGWIRVLLASGKAKPFIRELLAATTDYLHQHAPEIAAFLKQRICQYLQREGLIHPAPNGTLQRADELLVDAVSRTVMLQASAEVRNHLLADLKSEVLQRALVDRLPQHRSISDITGYLSDLVTAIQQEASWLALYVYGAYGQFVQLFQTVDQQAAVLETIAPATATTSSTAATVAQDGAAIATVAQDLSTVATTVASDAAALASATATVVPAGATTSSNATVAAVLTDVAHVDAAIVSAANDVSTVATTVASDAATAATTATTTTTDVSAALNVASSLTAVTTALATAAPVATTPATTIAPAVVTPATTVAATPAPDGTTKTVLFSWQAK
jgi:hypothetical protein